MVMYYYPHKNPVNQTVTFPSGTVYCDAFRNLAHGTYYRITLKAHELKSGLSNAARRRRAKVARRRHLLDPTTSNR